MPASATSTARSRTRNQAIKLNASYASAYNDRGLAYGAKGEIDQAISDFDQAIKLNPKSTQAFYNRGLTLRNRGDLDRTLADFDQTIRLNPNQSGALYARGNTQLTKTRP